MEDTAGDFFAGVEQVEANIGEGRGKLPVFYRDARCLTVVFPARLLEIRRLLPDRRYVPAQVAPGIGAVYMTAFEYRDTDIGPYNEFAIGFLMNSGDFLQVPVYNILRQMARRSFNAYILHLPVTEEIALRGGVDLYNYPKFMASIEFTDTPDRATCELSENGERICLLSARKIAATRSGVMKALTMPYQNRQPQSAEVKVNALKYGVAMGHRDVEFVLGEDHPLTRELDDLLISTSPIAYFYMPEMQAILYGPERVSLASVALFLERGLGVSLDELRRMLEKRT